MGIITDFHSHILPEMDDGSTSVEESISMLRLEAEQEISRVVATPHFYARYDTPDTFLNRRTEVFTRLQTESAQHSALPEICLGAEVAFCRGISEWEFLPQLALPGNRGILIEMPPAPWPEEAFRELIRIRENRDLIPVIAHIDRYIRPFRTHQLPQRLAQLPVLVQANAEFFLNRITASMALNMLKADQIQLLGSDCHNMSSRKPNLGTAVQRIRSKLGQDAVDMVHTYECMIMDV